EQNNRDREKMPHGSTFPLVDSKEYVILPIRKQSVLRSCRLFQADTIHDQRWHHASNQSPCPGAAAGGAPRGARAIARSVRLLARTEILALYSRRLSVAHQDPQMPRCAARTLFRLLQSS